MIQLNLHFGFLCKYKRHSSAICQDDRWCKKSVPSLPLPPLLQSPLHPLLVFDQQCPSAKSWIVFVWCRLDLFACFSFALQTSHLWGNFCIVFLTTLPHWHIRNTFLHTSISVCVFVFICICILTGVLYVLVFVLCCMGAVGALVGWCHIGLYAIAYGGSRNAHDAGGQWCGAKL